MTKEELEIAYQSITSTIRKNVKAYETLSKKDKPRVSQMKMIQENIDNFIVIKKLIEQRLQDAVSYQFTKEELLKVLSALPGYHNQIERVLVKFKEGTPQHTLAIRRIHSYRIGEELIQEEMAKGQ